jgi:hypothetical protein
MAMNSSELNSWFRDRARDQLRSFNKSIRFYSYHGVYVYRRSSNNDSSTHHRAQARQTYRGYNAGGQGSGVFNNDLATGLGAGKIAKSQDVAQSVANAVRSAVDNIERNLPSNVYLNWNFDARVCHSSCHNSCHGSRGRR